VSLEKVRRNAKQLGYRLHPSVSKSLSLQLWRTNCISPPAIAVVRLKHAPCFNLSEVLNPASRWILPLGHDWKPWILVRSGDTPHQVARTGSHHGLIRNSGFRISSGISLHITGGPGMWRNASSITPRNLQRGAQRLTGTGPSITHMIGIVSIVRSTVFDEVT